MDEEPLPEARKATSVTQLGAAMEYTSSFWRRLGAAAIDLVIADLVVALIVGWWAISSDSPARFTGGWLSLETCRDFIPNAGNPLGQWDKVQICDKTSDFIFPNRELVLQKIDKRSSITYTHTTRLFLNNAKEIVAVIRLDYLPALVWWLGASLFEASRWRATPGKRIFGLEVDGIDDRARLSQTLARNGLKLLWFLVLMIVEFADDIYLRSLWLHAVAEKSNYALSLPTWWLDGRLAVYCVVGIANVILVGSFIWPLKAMGRALYDRLPGTRVVFY